MVGALLWIPGSAQAAQRGDVRIHVSAIFGEARGVELPFAGTAAFSGLIDGIDPSIDRADLMVPGGGLTDLVTMHSSLAGGVTLVCWTTARDAAGAPTGGRCLAVGAVIAEGTLTITTFEPLTGGLFSFDVDLPRALCPRCQARS